MKETIELLAEKLYKTCDESQFNFTTTAELENIEYEIIGQRRASDAMKFGLSVKMDGYNVFMAGMTGTGKNTYARTMIDKIAKSREVPEDWCYVNNFENPSQPQALSLPAGMALELSKSMDELVESLKVEIPRAFEGDEYDKRRTTIMLELQNINSELFQELNDTAEQYGFMLQRTNTGFVHIPVHEGKTLEPEEFENLDDKVKKEIETRSTQIQYKTSEIMRKISVAEKESKEKFKQLDNSIGLFVVGRLIDNLIERFQEYSKVKAFLQAVQNDVLDHISAFRTTSDNDEQTFPWMKKNDTEDIVSRYGVNVFIDHRNTDGAPVIIENNPTYYNLNGRVEYENNFGVMTTNFMKIKPGAIHKANGGYLILQADDLFRNIQSWESLKRVLKTNELSIESLGDQLGMIATTSLKPEPIPIKLKVILIGSEYFYQLLYHYDNDFKKYFKIKADFDEQMKRSSENIQKIVQFIASYAAKHHLKPFKPSAVARVVEHGSYLVEHQEKLSTAFNIMAEVLCESHAWTQIDEATAITREHVEKAIQQKVYRSSKYEDRLQEMLEEGHILIDTHGKNVGQINGLSILNTGDYTFGRPSRITATTHLGRKGVINIEREVQMSGTIHSKGVMILQGYLGEKYAQDKPLALSARLTFEQLYSGVDGDSASSTELYALLSSLADIPIKQGIAVTGSVNQKGEIQPIGGINQKIEGFYKVCKFEGVTGEQGVMIPHQNVINLMLPQEIVKAVKNGKFHIYAVKTIDEGIKILTGYSAGEKDKEGNYPAETIHYLVDQKLRGYAEAIVNFGKEKEDVKEEPQEKKEEPDKKIGK